MSADPKFSVVVPAFNSARYLAATLDSLRVQEFKDYEVIVVDDGSTDDTPQILKRYESWIRVARQANAGPGRARNYGVSFAKGEYVAFLDSDDTWFPWTLSTYASVIEKYRKPELVAASVEMFSGDEGRKTGAEPLSVAAFADYYASSESGYFVGAGMMVVKRTRFLAAGGFTERRIYAEDHDLALRLGLVDGFVQVLSPKTLSYRQHAMSATRSRDSIFLGIQNLVEQETAGLYPGGAARKLDRIRLATLHVRPVSLQCLYHGEQRRAWKLYLSTIGWHLRLRRWKYVIGFPGAALLSILGLGRANEATPATGRLQ